MRRPNNPYAGREQTQAKHFILKRYLQALAFKVLTFSDVTYVDGFSGPWESKTPDFRDASFMIAISVLRDAQAQILERTKIRRHIRCFFSEVNSVAFKQLSEAVAPFHKPESGFEIETFHGMFEDAVPKINAFIGGSFPLIFIDPTGWTGYPFDKIGPLFDRQRCEVLINFMYDHINRFASSEDPDTIKSLEPILGGEGWRARLDPDLPRGTAVEKLFRETLKGIGRFRFVVSTRIDKATEDRPHFFITYGCKRIEGLKEFRQAEYDALRIHAKNRANAREQKRDDLARTPELFPGHDADVQEATIDDIVEEQKAKATDYLLKNLRLRGALRFENVVVNLLQPFMLRETNIKDICVALSKSGVVARTWGSGNRKPQASDLIQLILAPRTPLSPKAPSE